MNLLFFSIHEPEKYNEIPPFYIIILYCVILKKFASNFFFVFFLIFTFGKPNKEMNNACILFLYTNANDKCVLFVCLFISFIYFFYYLLRWICSRISAFVVFRAINTIQRIMNGLI